LTKDHSRVPLKRKLEHLYDFEIDSETIEGYKKRRKQNKEERVESILEGREEYVGRSKPQEKIKNKRRKEKR